MTERSSRTADRRPARNGRAGPSPVQAGGGRRITPGVIFLVMAIVGSIVYMAYTVTVRDTSQIPLLASGAVVLAVVFGALAAYSLRATWRAGTDGFAAGAIILFQVASGP